MADMPDGTILASTFVPGAPKTKGSLDAQPGPPCRCCAACKGRLPGGRMTENVKGSKVWRQLMAQAVRQCQRQMGMSTHAGAVTVVGTFYLPARSVIAAGAGDLDKLLRNALDAMQDAGTYGNDTQVVRIVTDKREATAEFPKGFALVAFAGRI